MPRSHLRLQLWHREYELILTNEYLQLDAEMTEMDNSMQSTKSAAPSRLGKSARNEGMSKKLTTKKLKKSLQSQKSFAVVIVGARNQSIFAFARVGLWDQTVGVRKGLPATYITEVSAALAMPRAKFLESLQLSRSTMEGRIKKNTLLTPAEGGVVLRAAKALNKAEEVFDDRAAASAWLKREIRSLGGVAPVSLMDTDSGFELVMNTLGRIEHGVVA